MARSERKSAAASPLQMDFTSAVVVPWAAIQFRKVCACALSFAPLGAGIASAPDRSPTPGSRALGSTRCVWLSTKPGNTTPPRASTSIAPRACSRFSILCAGPICRIRPSSTRMAPFSTILSSPNAGPRRGPLMPRTVMTCDAPRISRRSDLSIAGGTFAAPRAFYLRKTTSPSNPTLLPDAQATGSPRTRILTTWGAEFKLKS